MGCGRVGAGKDAKEDKLCDCTTYGTDNKDCKEPRFCIIKSVKLETSFNENSRCNNEKDKCDSKRPQIRHNCPLEIDTGKLHDQQELDGCEFLPKPCEPNFNVRIWGSCLDKSSKKSKNVSAEVAATKDYDCCRFVPTVIQDCRDNKPQDLENSHQNSFPEELSLEDFLRSLSG